MLTLCMLGNFECFLSSADFFKYELFQKNSFENPMIPIRVSKSLDPDEVQHFVRPDPGTICLQRLSAEETCRQRVNTIQ